MIHIQQPKVYRTQGRYIKRLIEPREVAALVAYLCSEAASVVTCATWTIDLGCGRQDKERITW